MAPIELNFEPVTKNDMFHVPLERAEQMVDEMAVVVRGVVDNYSEYRIIGTGQFEGKYRLDEGKTLKALLSIAQNTNEWLFILFNANPMFEKIRQLHQLNRVGKKIEAIMDKIIDEQIEKHDQEHD